MHSELSYGLSFAPKLQRVATMSLSGSHQPTPDPSFSPPQRVPRLPLLRASTSRRRRRHRFADCLWHHGPEMLMCGNRARDPRDVRRTDRDANTIFLRYHLIGVLGWLYPVGHPRTCPMCRTARSADLYCQLRRPGGASREPAGVT